MLKSLELFGFKSFADRTRFDFAPGVTCVVGPNGSGKSNVVDSIKWILGDQSAKSLRGKEMTDVIFNGSSSRKASGFAEATLGFDNSSGFLSIESKEVQVGRRLYRSGESEYLINKAPSRLKDVRELLMGTGAGSAAYSIIEQGRVDQLLQASSVNRRTVFEEAAGIRRFQSRKVDAQRRLERVGQNLARLTDIVQELEGRLNTMRQHAQKATRYRKYSMELRELRIGLAADDFRDYTAQITVVREERATWQADIDRLNALAKDVEQKQAALESNLTAVEDRVQEAQKRVAVHREAITGLEVTIGHQSTRRRELQAELVRLRNQEINLAGRARDIAGELRETEASLEQIEANFSQRRTELADDEQKIQESGRKLSLLLQNIEADRERLLQSQQQSAILSGRVTTMEARSEELEGILKTASRRAAGFQHALTDAEAELERRKKNAEGERAKLADLQTRGLEVQAELEQIQTAQADLQHRLGEQREQRSGWEARRQILEDLESRQDGIGVGVKEILERAQKSDLPPWNGIHGSVADLLQVDLEHAGLIEVALGARTQLIVLDEADPILEYLQGSNSRITGRVGFLTLCTETEVGQPTAQSLTVDLSDQPGVVDRADRLVRQASTVEGLAQQLLADTWIVTSLEAAIKLSEGEGQGYRFVTLQGELLETNGTLYAGTLQGETTLVSRKSELRRLKNELARLDRRIDQAEVELKAKQTSLRETTTRLSDLEAKSEICASAVTELETAVLSQRMKCEKIQQDFTETREAATSGRKELEECLSERDAARLERDAALALTADLTQTIKRGEANIDALERDLLQRREHVNANKVELAKHEERRESLQTARSRLDEERFQRDAYREEAELRFCSTQQKIEKIALQLMNTRAGLDERFLAQEQATLKLIRRRRELEEVRKARTQHSAEELKHRQELRQVEERSHAQEMRERDQAHQIRNLEERLQEEFGVNLSQAAEQEASALRLYLDQRRESEESEVEQDEPNTSAEHNDVLTHDVEPAPSPTAPPSPVVVQSPIAGEPPELIAEIRKEIEQRIETLRRKLKSIGHISPDNLQELEELETRYGRLNGQLQDLSEAKSSLEEIVRRINTESRRMFLETFEEIRGHFQIFFRKLFGGGDGDIILEDAEDILECGIDVVARPPGKELRSISLLSGGEKTLTAVAMLLALFQSRPSPFCILDEVDAALDDANIERYVGVIEEFRETTQFIVITHAKRTMVGADVIYGVTMEESGISKRMSVRFEDVSPDGHFKIRQAGEAA